MTGVRLRPVTLADMDALDTLNTPETAGDHNWTGFRQPGALRQRVEQRDTLSEERGMLSVDDADGTLVGLVSWIRKDNSTPPGGRCWNIGIVLLPEHRGRGLGTAAQRAVSDYLLAHSSYERVEAGTEADNVAEQRALEKAGFTREGVLRRAAFRDGQW